MTYDGPPLDPDYDTPPPDLEPPAYATETPPGATNGVPRGSSPTGQTTGRRPPADLDAERALLGALLINPHACIPAATNIVHGTDYYSPAHELIHNSIVTLHHAGQPVDTVTVVDHLRTTGQLPHIPDGPLALHDLHTAATLTSPAAVEGYAHIVRTTARRRLLETTGTRIAQIARTGDLTQLDGVLDQAYTTLDHAVTEYGPTATQTPTTWAPVDLTAVLAGDYLDPPPELLRRTDGIALFYTGGVHTVSGESESGKTWLCLLAALQELDKGNTVTFVDFEDRADRVIARLLALGAHPTQIRDHFAYIRPDRPLDDTGRHQLTPALVGRSLVILDGVTEAMTLHGYDLNSNEDSAKFQTLLPRWIADHGPAVTLIDHVVKDKEKQGRFAIGAQHKLAGIDGAAYVVKVIQPFARGKRGIAQIIVAKDRPGYVREQAFGKVIAEFALDGTHDNTTVIPELTPPGKISGRNTDGRPFEPTRIMEKISAYVATNPGLSKSAIYGVINGNSDAIRLGLELLVTRGYIHTKAGPRNSTQHYSHKPYRDTDDQPDNPTPDHTDQLDDEPPPDDTPPPHDDPHDDPESDPTP